MNVLSLLTIVLGIAGITGGAAGYFAKSRGDTIISLQGKEIDYWKDRATTLEKELTVEATKSLEKNVRIQALINQNEQLAQLGQGSPELIKLRRDINQLIGLVKKGRS